MMASPMPPSFHIRNASRRRFVGVLLCLFLHPVPLVAQRTASLPLIPAPREEESRPSVSLRRGIAVTAGDGGEDRFAAQELSSMLRERGVRVGDRAAAGVVTIALLRTESAGGRAVLEREGLDLTPAMREEGYVLVTDSARAWVVGATSAGVFYGTQTLLQLVEGTGASARMMGAKIRDWPAMRWRGIHDDLSRGPLPTLEFQKKQIRTFAAYKLNIYSPYFEHTLAFESQPLLGTPGGTISAEQVRELVAYAKRYHVEIVPEQQAFGHLHHMLTYELYSPLAETPHGHVLAPGQSGTLPLIAAMYAEIDSLFPGRFLHLGADETVELGRGQTAERARNEGVANVYVNFLSQLADLLRPMKRRLLFWGDIAMQRPDLIATLPKGLIAVPWNYDAKSSFDEYIQPFRSAGMETWVAPGVNNWSRVYPNYARALPNIQRFVRDGQRLGATGVLNTTWDDDGEALFAQCWYGVLFGAAASWQRGESSIDAFQGRYGRVFHGDTTGLVDSAQRDLASAHALLEQAGAGDAGDPLFWADPWSSEGQFWAGKIRPVAHDVRRLAEQALVSLARARGSSLRESDALDAIELGARRIDFIGLKFQLADEIAQIYTRARDTTDAYSARQFLADISGINGRTQDLREGYALLRDLYESAWMRENRPYWIHNVLARYDMSTQLWIARADRFATARRDYTRTRTLPTPAEMGIP